MAPGMLLQYVGIALAVMLSLGYLAKRQWPGPVRRLRIVCALSLLRDQRRIWRRKLGRWIAPPPPGSAGACAAGCGGCGSTPPRQ